MSMNKSKKPFFKKWWFWLIVVIIIFIGSAVSGGDDTTADSSPTTPPTTQTVTIEPSEASTEPSIAETLSIELIAGEQGEYGELFTINKGTEFEETYYIYHIPSGTYTVTNAGEYLNQITVCSDEVHVTDAGWEEHVEVPYAKSLQKGESDTFTIEDGQHIEIHEPARFILEKVG